MTVTGGICISNKFTYVGNLADHEQTDTSDKREKLCAEEVVSICGVP